jgi:starvation-inducible DNA-binding protein
MFLNAKSIRSVADSARKIMENVDTQALKEQNDFQLVAQMRKILADGYTFYFKAHTFHWNVEGSNFPQYHEFFGKVYEQVFASLDPIAEEMRALKAYAPSSLRELLAIASISETSNIPSPQEMLAILINDNEKIIVGLTAGYKLAETAGEAGLSNFFQDLIDKHKKLGWMLTSTNKGA